MGNGIVIALVGIMVQIPLFGIMLATKMDRNKSELDRIATALERILAEEDYEGERDD